VTAAVEASRPGSHVEGHVARLVEDIRPAVAATQGQQGDPVDLAVRANVRLVADQLRTSKPLLAPWVAEGRVRIVGALYHLSTGQVEVF
jgi:carbonic anhydrase